MPDRQTVRDVVAAVGFLNGPLLPEDLRERLADASDGDIDRILELIGLRQERRELWECSDCACLNRVDESSCFRCGAGRPDDAPAREARP